MNSDKIPRIACLVIVLAGFFGALTLLFFVPIDPSARDVLNIMIGALVVMAKQQTDYWTVSSSGSDRKTELLAMATPPPGAVTTVAVPASVTTTKTEVGETPSRTPP